MIWWRLVGMTTFQFPAYYGALLASRTTLLATKDSPAATYAHKELVRVLPSTHRFDIAVGFRRKPKCVSYILDPQSPSMYSYQLSQFHACTDIDTMSCSLICMHATQVANDCFIVTTLFFFCGMHGTSLPYLSILISVCPSVNISAHKGLMGHFGPSQLTLGVPMGFTGFTGRTWRPQVQYHL